MKTLLQQLSASPAIYGRFLNTLSLLEYIGARKILKSQKWQCLNEQVLGHIAEEIRHAQILKRAASKVAPDSCRTYAPDALLCGQQAYEYFQTIDSAAEKIFNPPNPWHAYLYTTFLIETRAISFYTEFMEVLAETGQANPFRGILAEEKKHLDEVLSGLQTTPDYQQNLQSLQKIEAEAFKQFIQAIEQTLQAKNYLVAEATT